jgi:hypothetical protein
MQKKMTMLVHFNQINVNAIENASGIFVGTNTQLGWDTHNKSNVAMGHISGDYNRLYHNINILQDGDFMDTYISDRDIMIDNRKTYSS